MNDRPSGPADGAARTGPAGPGCGVLFAGADRRRNPRHWPRSTVLPAPGAGGPAVRVVARCPCGIPSWRKPAFRWGHFSAAAISPS